MRLVHGLLAAACLAVGCRTPNDVPPPGDGLDAGTTAPNRATPSPRSSKGGALNPTTSEPAATNAPPGRPMVLPASGRVHTVNLGLRFIVVDYTLGGMPPMGSLLTVFRNNEKVAQVRLSGPEPRNGFVTADILEGYVQPDDEVRLH